MPLFDGLLKPGDAAELMVKRELERRRDAWTPKPDYIYRGGGDYMLRHGRPYRGQALPDGYERMEENQCFWNALQMARDNPNLRYVEGVYSTSNAHPTPHAWVIDPDDKVIEVTHVTRDLERYHDHRGMFLMPPEHWIYHGVVFPWELADWHYETVGEFCMFDRPAADAREWGDADFGQDHDWPILKYPYNPTRVALW